MRVVVPRRLRRGGRSGGPHGAQTGPEGAAGVGAELEFEAPEVALFGSGAVPGAGADEADGAVGVGKGACLFVGWFGGGVVCG